MQPSLELAARVLPKPLYQAISHVFAQCRENVALVGGTALAGFYAGHRRSDDMDLFTKNEVAQRGAVLAVKSLKSIGARISEESHTPLYYHAVCELDRHVFTADVVLDENLFHVGDFGRVGPNILVARLNTLIAMKTAALVSRSSEKDIFDLKWLMENNKQLRIADLIALGMKIDGGASAENILASLGGAVLREDACDFSLNPKITKAKIFKEIQAERSAWIRKLRNFLKDAPPPPLASLVKEVRKKQRRR